MDVNAQEILKIEDYSFYYPEGKKAVLAHVDFSIFSGEFVLLCGKSGCGKSTLLRQFKGTLCPHGNRSGPIWFDGGSRFAGTKQQNWFCNAGPGQSDCYG